MGELEASSSDHGAMDRGANEEVPTRQGEQECEPGSVGVSKIGKRAAVIVFVGGLGLHGGDRACHTTGRRACAADRHGSDEEPGCCCHKK